MVIALKGKREQHLLLFLEHCVVEYGGAVDNRSLNDADIELCRQWATIGLINFVEFHDPACRYRTHRVDFETGNDAAWQEAHRLRRERAASSAKTLNRRLKCSI